VRIFKTSWFSRFAGKESITDDELIIVVNQLEEEQDLVNLGGDVFKVRVARTGEGKSGGYRIIVFFRSKEKTFFVYGFSKSKKDNIDQKEKRDFKVLSKKYFALTDDIIKRMVKMGKLFEIKESKNE